MSLEGRRRYTSLFDYNDVSDVVSHALGKGEGKCFRLK